MSTTQGLLRSFGEVSENPVLLEKSVTAPICEGLNVALASFQALYLQYQKHHFTVEGSEFYSLHQFFQESYEEVQEHVHDLGERLNGLGGVPAASFVKLAQLCCFTPELEGAYDCRQMVKHDLAAERASERASNYPTTAPPGSSGRKFRRSRHPLSVRTNLAQDRGASLPSKPLLGSR